MFEVANLFETDCQTHLSFVQRVSFLKKIFIFSIQNDWRKFDLFTETIEKIDFFC